MRSNSVDGLAERFVTGLLADVTYRALMSLVRHGALNSLFKCIFGSMPAALWTTAQFEFEAVIDHAPVDSNRVFTLT